MHQIKNTPAKAGFCAPRETLTEADFQVPSDMAGKRLDAIAAIAFEAFSRSRLQHWISEGYLTVDGQQRRTRDKLLGGELLSLQLPSDELVDDSVDSFEPEPMDLSIVFEDEHIIVINKPAGLVMHPAPGNRQGTLLNGLLHHHASQAAVPRAGIVHRLDKETSGLVCRGALTRITHAPGATTPGAGNGASIYRCGAG